MPAGQASSFMALTYRGRAFTANKRLDELANPFAYTDLDLIKPVVEKVGGGVRCRLEGIRLRGNVCHGVVSVPALQRRMIRGSPRRLRQPNSHHFRYGTATYVDQI